MSRVPFRYLFKKTLNADGSVDLAVVDPTLQSLDHAGQFLKLTYQVDGMRALARVRILFRRHQMKKLWRMALNGQFGNFARKP